MSDKGSMITVSLYFEVHDADLYGGKGSVGYANNNLDFEISKLNDEDLNTLAETARQGVADMCGVDKEKVINISRTYYEEETSDEYEDDWEE